MHTLSLHNHSIKRVFQSYIPADVRIDVRNICDGFGLWYDMRTRVHPNCSSIVTITMRCARMRMATRHHHHHHHHKHERTSSPNPKHYRNSYTAVAAAASLYNILTHCARSQSVDAALTRAMIYGPSACAPFNCDVLCCDATRKAMMGGLSRSNAPLWHSNNLANASSRRRSGTSAHVFAIRVTCLWVCSHFYTCSITNYRV